MNAGYANRFAKRYRRISLKQSARVKRFNFLMQDTIVIACYFLFYLALAQLKILVVVYNSVIKAKTDY